MVANIDGTHTPSACMMQQSWGGSENALAGQLLHRFSATQNRIYAWPQSWLTSAVCVARIFICTCVLSCQFYVQYVYSKHLYTHVHKCKHACTHIRGTTHVDTHWKGPHIGHNIDTCPGIYATIYAHAQVQGVQGKWRRLKHQGCIIMIVIGLLWYKIDRQTNGTDEVYQLECGSSRKTANTYLEAHCWYFAQNQHQAKCCGECKWSFAFLKLSFKERRQNKKMTSNTW